MIKKFTVQDINKALPSINWCVRCMNTTMSQITILFTPCPVTRFNVLNSTKKSENDIKKRNQVSKVLDLSIVYVKGTSMSSQNLEKEIIEYPQYPGESVKYISLPSMMYRAPGFNALGNKKIKLKKKI